MYVQEDGITKDDVFDDGKRGQIGGMAPTDVQVDSAGVLTKRGRR